MFCSVAEAAVLGRIMKGTPGWVALHVAAILLTFWLGAVTRFAP